MTDSEPQRGDDCSILASILNRIREDVITAEKSNDADIIRKLAAVIQLRHQGRGPGCISVGSRAGA
jgi:hypothetical protein